MRLPTKIVAKYMNHITDLKCISLMYYSCFTKCSALDLIVTARMKVDRTLSFFSTYFISNGSSIIVASEKGEKIRETLNVLLTKLSKDASLSRSADGDLSCEVKVKFAASQ